MKQVRLLKLELTNYRNIAHEVYDFGGNNAKIVGENRIGKTNTLEAIYFLLTNYLLDGSNDLTALKPLDDTKRVVSVKGTFDVDGKELTLEKQYGENWVKKRGTEELVLDGHYEDYYFNGVKQTRAKDYYIELGKHFGYRNDEKGEVDVAQMMSNPLYLGNLGETKDWTLLRKFIVDLIGDVTDEEVYQAEPSTLLIKEDMELNLNSVEQVKKKYSNDIKGIEQTITMHNSNIAMLEKTPKPTDEEVELARKGVEEHQTKIAQLQSATGTNQVVQQYEKLVSDLKQDVLNLNMKEFKAYQEHGDNPNAELDKQIADLNKEVADLTEEKISTNESTREAMINQGVARSKLETNKQERAKLVEELKSIRELMKQPVEVETVCPTCGRPYEDEDVEKRKAQIMEDYHSKEQNIITKGKEVAEKIKNCEQDVNKYEPIITNNNNIVADIDKKIATRKQRVEELKGNRVPTTGFVESEELKDLRAKLNEAEKQLEQAKLDESKAHTLGVEQIEKEREAMFPFQKVLDDKTYYDRQMQVLNGVKVQKAECDKKLVELEQKKECLNTYIRAKLELLDKHVSKVFGNIRFQLVKENLNGGYDQVCKPYIYDIEKDVSTTTTWKNGSKSEKIITGIAIAEAIKKELDLTELPYVFDEGGEISTDTFNTKFKTDAQIICVKVEDNIMKPVVVNF